MAKISRICVSTSDDRKAAVLDFGYGKLTLTTEQLEKVLGALVEVRAQLIPEVPRSFGSAGSISACQNPSIETGRDALQSRVLMKIRSPGHGWWAAAFDPDYADKVGTALLATVGEIRQLNRGKLRN